MVAKILKGHGEVKKLTRHNKPVRIDEAMLTDLENKYNLDREKLAEIGVIPGGAARKVGAA
jgi:hypothetical protein